LASSITCRSYSRRMAINLFSTTKTLE
jgi:hypothetical protein